MCYHDRHKKEKLTYNPYMLPLGRLVLTLGGDWHITSGALEPFSGTARLDRRVTVSERPR